MKLRMILVLLTVVVALPGCSLLDGVNNSLDYANEAASYANEVTRFVNEIPALAQQAVTNPEAREAVKKQLEGLKEQIASFNGLEAPAYAKDIHRQLTAANETLRTEVNRYLDQINQGIMDWTSLANSPLTESIMKLTDILKQVPSLSN